MNDDFNIREQIIKTGICLVEKGLVQGTGGNISVRNTAGFLITPSGMDYLRLVPDDIVAMDLFGNVLNGSRKPSVEKDMHRMILAARPDISVVIHTHSTYATAVASARQPLKPITDNQVAVFGGTIPVAEYGPIGSELLAGNAAAALVNGYGILLANHGSLCVGGKLEETLYRCEMLETFARIFLLAKLAGGGVVLSEEEVCFEAVDIKKRYGQGDC